MALDFHKSDTNEFLFGLDNKQYLYLSLIFDIFHQWTGLEVNLYKSMQLTKENCQTLLRIIDGYFERTDLNKDKQNTIEILGFRGVLKYFVEKNINFLLQGD